MDCGRLDWNDCFCSDFCSVLYFIFWIQENVLRQYEFMIDIVFVDDFGFEQGIKFLHLQIIA